MKSIYHAGYQLALPNGHPFPMSKYGLLKELLLTDGVIALVDIIEPDPIDLHSAALVHTPGYLEKLESQSLSAAELRRLGLPWSQELWLRSRLAAGGTLRTARAALEFGSRQSRRRHASCVRRSW